MHLFGWVGREPAPPAHWDLRLAGWRLFGGGKARFEHSNYPLLIEDGTPHKCLAELVGREWILLLGVDRSAERAGLIADGYAEALGRSVRLAELAARAERVIAHSSRMPRRRRVGPVTLDLCHRDAQVAGRWIGLYPREFELFWRLTEQPGSRITRRQLLKDVWRLDYDPETNRVEVHVSRLRAKLGYAGVGDIIGTDPAGGYFIRPLARAPVRQLRDEAVPGAYTRPRA